MWVKNYCEIVFVMLHFGHYLSRTWEGDSRYRWSLLWKYCFLLLCRSIRVKWHFPLKIPISYYRKTFIRGVNRFSWIVSKWDEVSSAKYLNLHRRPFVKLLIWTKNSKGPRIEPWWTAEFHLGISYIKRNNLIIAIPPLLHHKVADPII